MSTDMLRISSGANLRSTLVDLPGLIHATRSSQTEEDVHASRALTEEYLKNKRTIVLAVISAKNDYANQIIVHLCKQHKAVPRTLGVITKPDYLPADSEAESNWVSLSDNQEVCLGYGWHWLKNLETSSSAEDRLRSENDFFSRGIWSTRDQSTLGIEPLRSKLCSLNENLLCQELPKLRLEIGEKFAETRQKLAGLGEPLSNISMKRGLLFELSLKLCSITHAAIKGDYESSFFGNVDTSADIDSKTNVPRLRAVIQHLNRKFTKHMYLHGHKYTIGRNDLVKQETLKTPDPQLTEFLNLAFGGIEDVLEDDPEGNWSDIADDEPFSSKLRPKIQNRLQAEKWVLTVLQRCKGRELPGSYNPELIRTLFAEQSGNWEYIATTHINHVSRICRSFLSLALKHCAREDMQDRLFKARIRPAFKEKAEIAQEELKKILKDKDGDPMTLSHSFMLAVQRLRHRKYGGVLKHFSRANTTVINVDGPDSSSLNPQIWARDWINPEKLREVAREAADMDRFSASEALDSQIAYYQACVETEKGIGYLTNMSLGSIEVLYQRCHQTSG